MAICWRTFDDFDAFGEAIRSASLRMACDSAEHRVWRLAAAGIGDLFLQVADEGGGNLCQGGNTHGGLQVFVPLSQATAHICNCEPLDAESIDRPAVARLAAAAGVTDRTLARAFRDTFGVSPLQYVLLRQLHAVRRDLRAATGAATVSAVLMRHGIWDHGRFAARYRRHFGESPSATLPRSPSRVHASGSSKAGLCRNSTACPRRSSSPPPSPGRG